MTLSAHTFIQQLEQRLQQSFKTEDDGIQYFTYKKHVSVGLRYTQDPYILECFACFGDLPKDLPKDFYKQLLKAHFFGLETLNAIFALSEDNNKLYFTRTLECNRMNEEANITELWRFCETFLIWKKRLLHLL
jgi:hypothetical protein